MQATEDPGAAKQDHGTTKTAKKERDWQFEIVPYLWMAGVDGEVGGTSSIGVDETFDSITDFLQGAFMGAIRVQYKRFGLLADGNVMSLGGGGALQGPMATAVDIDFDMAFGTAAFAYEFEPEPGFAVDPYIGARWWSIDSSAQIMGGVLGTQQTDFSTSWADPVFGVYLRNDISDRWFVEFAGDVGGGVSKITWQVYGAVGYQVADWFGLSAGYRFLGVDYDQDDFVFDVVMQGLLLGIRFDF